MATLEILTRSYAPAFGSALLDMDGRWKPKSARSCATR